MNQLRTLLSRVSGLPPSARILDYGCGAAGCTELLKEMFPSAEIHGIDISSEAIKTARERFPDYHFSVFDGSNAPYPEGSFDLIFSSHVLEHVRDLDQSVSDMVRLLRPGGVLCVTLPCANEGSLESTLTSLMRDGIITSPTGERKWFWEDPTHLRRVRSDDLVARFKYHGLRLCEAFFGNQFWGGIEGVCQCGPGIIGKWLRVSKGNGITARVKLAAAKLVLYAVSPIYLALFEPVEKAGRFRGSKMLLCYAAVPIRWLYLPVARWIRKMADKEWDERRHIPKGASQFLVMQK